MLTVAFIGYKKYEYDLADEMERVARERAAVREGEEDGGVGRLSGSTAP